MQLSIFAIERERNCKLRVRNPEKHGRGHVPTNGVLFGAKSGYLLEYHCSGKN
jgi:hypothetical protein